MPTLHFRTLDRTAAGVTVFKMRGWAATLGLLVLAAAVMSAPADAARARIDHPKAKTEHAKSRGERPKPRDDPSIYVIRHDRWSAADEKGYRRFIETIGASDCNTVNSCLHSEANPYRASDPPGYRFVSDCAALPYVLRFYYAWKNGLPFSYESRVVARDGSHEDLRYTRYGNVVAERTDVPGGVMTGYEIINKILRSVSSANYRIHPDLDGRYPPDFYSPKIDLKSIRPGTVIYDPAGHLAIVYKIDADGRVHFFDAHTDYSLTQMVYDLRFARERPAAGAGFKNWRPIRLVGAKRMKDGTLRGGHIIVSLKEEIPDFSDEQYYGNGPRPSDADWASGTFTLNDEKLDYYDYVRAMMAGGHLLFDPIDEIREMTWSLCSDLHYRIQAVDIALAAGIQDKPEPPRLPENIYGTSGDWEMYSTPSRDARLKTAFKALRDTARRFYEMQKSGDTKHLSYSGDNIVKDMLNAYKDAADYCAISYTRTDGNEFKLTYEDARKRLFAMSFDPYQCAERRWGATDKDELSTCDDDDVKKAWYKGEQNLRNQIDRTYDAKMDFTLEDLQKDVPGTGVTDPPDTDTRAYLEGLLKAGDDKDKDKDDDD